MDSLTEVNPAGREALLARESFFEALAIALDDQEFISANELTGELDFVEDNVTNSETVAPQQLFQPTNAEGQALGPDNVILGGSGDCWRSLFFFQLGDESSEPKTLKELEQFWDELMSEDLAYWKERDFTTEPYEGTVEDLSKYTLQELVQKEKTRVYVRVTEQEPGKLHLEEVMQNMVPFFLVPESESARAASIITPPGEGEGFITLDKLFSYSASAVLGSSSGSVVESLNEAKRIYGTENLKNEANNEQMAELASLPTIPFSMDKNTLAKFSKYVGYDVRSTQRTNSQNGHLFLQAARYLARDRLEKRYPHNTDFRSVLHVGCTIQEVRRYLSHAGHDFYFHLTDDKDVKRLYEDLSRIFGAKLANMNLPALASIKGNVTNWTAKNVEDLLYMIGNQGRQRFFFNKEDITRKYDVLIFEDCLYNIPPEEFAWWWDKTSAKIGHAITFFPDVMIDERAAPSDMYVYQEKLPTQAMFEDIYEEIWPAVMVLFPLLPGMEELKQVLHDVISNMLTKGLHVAKDVLCSPFQVTNPFWHFMGIATELAKWNPIIEQIVNLYGKMIFNKLCVADVGWRHGTGNGYSHHKDTWRKYAACRRWRRRSGLYVDSEVMHMDGEIWTHDFYSSAGLSEITYTITLPEHKATIQVLDLFNSYKPGLASCSSMVPKYLNVSKKDMYTIRNWAYGEPVESLTINTIITMIMRVRGGLSLNSNQLVASMSIVDQDVKSIALSVLMDAYQMSDIASAIENDPEINKAYKSNARILGENVLKIGMIAATLGLAIPAYYIFKWLVEVNPTIQFMIDPKEPRIYKVGGRSRKVERDVLATSIKPLLDNTRWVFPHKDLTAPVSCYMCEMQRRGKFSASTVPSEGQEFVCHQAGVDNEFDVGFDAAELPALSTLLKDTKDWHMAQNALKTVESIRKLDHYVDAKMAGFSHKVRIEHIRGGPGTGKSVVIRVLAKTLMAEGLDPEIVMPFRALLEDYNNVSVFGYSGKTTFSAHTLWSAPSAGPKDVLIVDECTGVRWDVIRILAAYMNVKKIILVGDKAQTHLNSSAGEGIDPTNPQSGLDWSRIPIHELVWNYRLNAWVVKYLNKTYGYKMKSRDTRNLPPRIISRANYKGEERSEVERELVFSHASAEPIFGFPSTPGDENHSIRSSQGKTFSKVAVSASRFDKSLIGEQGMLCVAVSRSRTETVFVASEDPSDITPTELAKQLMIDTDENKEYIWNLPWPETNSGVPEHILKPDEQAVNAKLVRDAKERNSIKVEKKEYYEDEEDRVFSQIEDTSEPSTIDLREAVPVIPDYPLWDAYMNIFQTCFFDVVIDAKPELKGEVYKYLEKVYFNDHLMRRKTKGEIVIWSDEEVVPTTDRHDGVPKMAFKSEPLLIWAAEHNLGICIFGQDKYKPEFMSKLFLSRDHDHPDNVVMRNTGDHVKPYKAPIVLVSHKNFQVPVQYSVLRKVDGHYVFNGKRKIGTQLFSQGQDVFDLDAPSILAEPESVRYLNARGQVPVIGRPDPTLHRLQKVEFERKDENFVQGRAPITSSYSQRPVFTPPILIKQAIMKTKERFGTNGFKLISFLDPTGAMTRFPCINPHSAVRGHLGKNNIKLNWAGFLFDRTASGKLKARRTRQYRSALPGYVQHFNDTPEETLVAAQRLGKIEAKPRLDKETKVWAEKVATKYFNEMFKGRRLSAEEANYVLHGAQQAVKQRNYFGRAKAIERKDPIGKLKLTIANKSIVKFKDPIDVFKGGQALSMSPPRFNAEYVPYMRLVNNTNKMMASEELYFDDYENAKEFRKRVMLGIQNFGDGVRFGIADARSFDSQQNEVTVHMEKTFTKLLLGTDLHIDDYYRIRDKIPYVCFGYFKGVMNYEKGSGLPDTKYGNQTITGALSHHRYEGIGPKMVAVKGDDYLRIQYGLKINKERDREIRVYTGMDLVAEVGDGGSFIGHSVSRHGMVPNIVNKAIKAVAAKSRDYKHFCEQQIAYRDAIDDIRDSGVVLTTGLGAEACGYSRQMGELAYTVLNSLAHISKAQWIEMTRPRKEMRYHLNTAEGPTLI